MVLHSYTLLCNCIISHKGSGGVTGSFNIPYEGSRDITGEIFGCKMSSSNTHRGSYNIRNEGSEVETNSCSSGREIAQIEVNVRFSYPSFVLQPSITAVYNIITRLLGTITDIIDLIQPCVGGLSEMDDEKTELMVDSIHKTHVQLEQFFEGTCTCVYSTCTYY